MCDGDETNWEWVYVGDGLTRGACFGDRFRFTLPYGLWTSLKRGGSLAGIPLLTGGHWWCVW